MALVYQITNTKTGKVYIGYTSYTLEERVEQHFRDATKVYNGTSRKFYNSIQKHGINCWKYKTLVDDVSVEKAKQLEIKLINEFDSYNSGYNSTKGGDGNNGIIMSKESNQARSKALKGIPKNYNRMLGKTHSKETKQKISDSHKGMKKTWVKWTKEQVKARSMQRRALTEEQYKDILRLRTKGLTIKEVSQKVGVSVDLVKKWAKLEW